MATNGQFCWPPVNSSVAAYGQFGMADNTEDSLRARTPIFLPSLTVSRRRDQEKYRAGLKHSRENSP